MGRTPLQILSACTGVYLTFFILRSHNICICEREIAILIFILKTKSLKSLQFEDLICYWNSASVNFEKVILTDLKTLMEYGG